jgi:hypothetical protein
MLINARTRRQPDTATEIPQAEIVPYGHGASAQYRRRDRRIAAGLDSSITEMRRLTPDDHAQSGY